MQKSALKNPDFLYNFTFMKRKLAVDIHTNTDIFLCTRPLASFYVSLTPNSATAVAALFLY